MKWQHSYNLKNIIEKYQDNLTNNIKQALSQAQLFLWRRNFLGLKHWGSSLEWIKL